MLYIINLDLTGVEFYADAFKSYNIISDLAKELATFAKQSKRIRRWIT